MHYHIFKDWGTVSWTKKKGMYVISRTSMPMKYLVSDMHKSHINLQKQCIGSDFMIIRAREASNLDHIRRAGQCFYLGIASGGQTPHSPIRRTIRSSTQLMRLLGAMGRFLHFS